MAKGTKLKSDGCTITVRVPISLRKRGGKTVVLAPDGTIGGEKKLVCREPDAAMVKALARAFRWRDMLETQRYATIKEVAAAERIAETYVGRVLRLTLLSPVIVEAILAGRQPPVMTLPLLMRSFPSEWSTQRELLLSGKR